MGEEGQRRHLRRRVDDLCGDPLGIHLLQPPADIERSELASCAGGVAGVEDLEHVGRRAGRQRERVEIFDVLADQLEDLRPVALLEVRGVHLNRCRYVAVA